MSITQLNTQMNKTLTGMKQAQPTEAAIQKKTSNTGTSADVLGLRQQMRNMQNVRKANTFNNAYNNYLQKNTAAAPAPAAQPTVVTPTFSNDVDYAAQMRQLASTPVTAEGQKQMGQLAAAREAKILAGGEGMAQYANDDVAKMAQNYMRQYVPAATDMSAYYDKADALAQQMYDENVASLDKQNAAQLENLRQNFDKARREAALAYAMKSRGLENVLAEQGIGRGLGAAPSSGYSETARLGALSDYANSINQTYQQQDAATRELQAQFEAARLQAMMQRYSAMMDNQYARADQANADRNYGLSVHQYNTGLDQFNEQMDYQKEEDTLDRQYQNEAFAYQKEQDTLDRQYQNEAFAYQKEQDALDRAYDERVFAEDVRQFDKNYELDKQNAYKSGSDGGYYGLDLGDPFGDGVTVQEAMAQAAQAPLADGEIKRTVGLDENDAVVLNSYQTPQSRGSAAANNASRNYQPSWQAAGWKSSSSLK